ncbi:hydrogenase maturation nickel metallochaperone HypA/HybF, partial [Acidihalobacter prosperus]
CIRVEIGALATLETTALLFCFNAIKGKTIASDAVLEIIEQPALGYCLECFQQVEITKRTSPCPKCGAYQLQVNQGDSLKIRELEVT